ncbi:MAG TPA: CoA transferase [Methylomirabilota bacterium]|nr:CoA transferase [Methylomirabilota bacterium]
MTANAQQQPMLAGIKVLDFTQYLAGPTATRLMAELGAEIIKVEQAKSGDPSRALPFLKDGRSVYFIQQNRGKKSLCVDFSKSEGVELIRALIPKVDVVIENYGPGVMEKRGLDYESLKQLHPGIIMCSVSAFGRNSPMSHLTGYDYIAQAFSGIMHMTGDPDGPPRFVGVAIADGIAGVNAFAALGYALFHRDRTGQGQYIDIAMVDALYHMQSVEVQMFAASKGAYKPLRFGIHHYMGCPQGVFKGPTGWIVILALDRQWPNVARALGKPELTNDPRFASAGRRGRNQKELIAIIEAWMQTFPDDDAVLKVLAEHRVPAGPVLSIEETVSHPYFIARRMVRQVPDRILGEVTIPGFPFKFSAFPDELPLQAPFLGEHNEEVLSQYLGRSQDSIAALYQQGILYKGDK